jgi:inorganic pyrophosphatase
MDALMQRLQDAKEQPCTSFTRPTDFSRIISFLCLFFYMRSLIGACELNFRAKLMNLNNLPLGNDVPNDVNVVIEIPAHGPPVKYEVDKDSGMLVVDRFMGTAMLYPCNYGFIPHTLSADDDPVDVLVVTPLPLISGVVINCRPIGMLRMTDEAGEDHKLLAVPVSKVCTLYDDVLTPSDLHDGLLGQITHFFEQYKALEPGKWVKVDRWTDAFDAKDEILKSIERYNQSA